MRVYELIEMLQRCTDQSAIVYYDIEQGLKNEDMYVACNDETAVPDKPTHFAVDDVLVGSGTLKGIVYLTEEPYE